MVDLGVFRFHLYGLLVGLGILVGFWIAEKVRLEIARIEEDYKKFSVWDGFWWVMVPGVIGARLYHVFGLWNYYRVNLLLIPAIWKGGLGIFGAIIGGLIGLFFFVLKEKIRFWKIADLVAFGLPVGQAIGRWGNYFNQELYGKPFDFAQGKPPFWAIYIDLNNRISGSEQYSYYHPLFLYESLWNLFIFGVLVFLLRKRGSSLKSGSYFALYLMLYGFGRFWLEFLRIESWMIRGVSVAQIFSVYSVFMGAVMFSCINSRLCSK